MKAIAKNIIIDFTCPSCQQEQCNEFNKGAMTLEVDGQPCSICSVHLSIRLYCFCERCGQDIDVTLFDGAQHCGLKKNDSNING